MEQIVYTLKVHMKGNSKIWRRMVFLSSQTLEDVHKAVFEAYDRVQDTSYALYFPDPAHPGRDPRINAREFLSPQVIRDTVDLGQPRVSAADTTLVSLGLSSGQTFHYLFDFDEEYWHVLEVENTQGEPDGGRYPRIIKRRGDSPPHRPSFRDEQY